MKQQMSLLLGLIMLAGCSSPEQQTSSATDPYVKLGIMNWIERDEFLAMLKVVFDPDSKFPLTLTSGTLITPDLYPFSPFEPELIAK